MGIDDSKRVGEEKDLSKKYYSQPLSPKEFEAKYGKNLAQEIIDRYTRVYNSIKKS